MNIIVQAHKFNVFVNPVFNKFSIQHFNHIEHLLFEPVLI